MILIYIIVDDAELDAAISQLESAKLPTEEEQQAYLDGKDKLEQTNNEVVQLKEKIDSLERFVEYLKILW